MLIFMMKHSKIYHLSSINNLFTYLPIYLFIMFFFTFNNTFIQYIILHFKYCYKKVSNNYYPHFIDKRWGTRKKIPTFRKFISWQNVIWKPDLSGTFYYNEPALIRILHPLWKFHHILFIYSLEARKIKKTYSSLEPAEEIQSHWYLDFSPWRPILDFSPPEL